MKTVAKHCTNPILQVTPAILVNRTQKNTIIPPPLPNQTIYKKLSYTLTLELNLIGYIIDVCLRMAIDCSITTCRQIAETRERDNTTSHTENLQEKRDGNSFIVRISTSEGYSAVTRQWQK